MNSKLCYKPEIVERTETIPLALTNPGQRVKIVSIVAGRGLKQRLISMGLDIGFELEVIKSEAPGPLLIAIKETRLAIGRGIAYKIMVSQSD